MNAPASKIVDLRSDTVTKPTPEMRAAMAAAEVGDDVFSDDPTVNALQDRVARLLGKEAALFVPSGTMANQIAIRLHTTPGGEIITHQDSHIYHYEGGGAAAWSGCSLRLLPGERGLITADQVRAAVRPDDSHYPLTSLVSLENTHNRGGGSCWSAEVMAEIKAVADEFHLPMHLDGARLMNACVATGLPPTVYTEHFDTVSICFSKSLGAPVGSALAGSAALTKRAHRYRKMFGGGMRQAGIIAAGALYALDHHVERLEEDHANAKRLAEGVDEISGYSVDLDAVETNIVNIQVDPKLGLAAQMCERLEAAGVWMLPIWPQTIRAVTHLDVSAEGIERALEVFRGMRL